MITIAAGCGLAAVHYHGGGDGGPKGWFAAVGFAAPFIGVAASGQFYWPQTNAIETNSSIVNHDERGLRSIRCASLTAATVA